MRAAASARLLPGGLAVLLLAAGAASGQVVIYRQVGTDGRVTFSDRPLGEHSTPVNTSASPGAADAPTLPLALRQLAERYPVTLYAGPDCGPCDAARQLLTARGVPFSERTVQTGEDVEALQRLAGEASLPVATIGAQRLRGFSAPEWTQYLDAAGYPATSQLPAGYRPPAPQPLVALQPVPALPRPAAPSAGATGSAPADGSIQF
ncbi:glutaredoxin family protein [Pseudorhodoferax sp.]|uniref:glutaredoxin family protein n=1 Tax=Pseudorhodoferax sp. TaxID=1993553 RepID=UPI0039E689E4